MANTGWRSYSDITFNKIGSSILDSGTAAQTYIEIDDSLIGYGTINSVTIQYTAQGHRANYERATVRTGYINESGSYVWVNSHTEGAAQSDETPTPWTDYLKDGNKPVRSNSGKYRIGFGAINFQAFTNLTVYIRSIKIYIDYTPKQISYSFVDWDGTSLKSGTVDYNTAPTAPANPSRTGYTFTGWSPAVGAITSTAKYTAQYKINTYTLTVTAGTGGDVSGGGTYNYGSTATLTATPKAGYRFVKWNDDAKATATRTVTVTGNATYTATFEKLKYTVTWKNHDGTTLETDTNVEYGTTPSYNGATPTKASTAQHAYTFSGWSPSVSAVTGNVTYTAQFTATVRKYTVKWYNYDGTLLETDTDVPYGTKPTYNGATPTKPSDDYYNYGFAGWSPSINEGIQGDKNFTAQFAQTDRYYTVRWVNASAEQGVEGALLETDEVKFNTQPDYNGATPKHPKQDTDPALNYDFIGWSAKVTDPAKPDTELEKVKGNITYTAIYETTPKLYAITVILFDSQSTDVYEYGTEVTIEAPEIVDFHRFIKWSDGDTRRSRPITVTGVATYQAVYERIPVPVKVNKEQVTGCYIVPTTKTIVYVISGTVPTVETKRESVDGWSFLVSNSIPENGYPLKKLFITESGVTTRVY